MLSPHLTATGLQARILHCPRKVPLMRRLPSPKQPLTYPSIPLHPLSIRNHLHPHHRKFQLDPRQEGVLRKCRRLARAFVSHPLQRRYT